MAGSAFAQDGLAPAQAPAAAQGAPNPASEPQVVDPAAGQPPAANPPAELQRPAPQAYLQGAARASDVSVAAFLADPTGLLSRNAAAGSRMNGEVRQLAGTDDRTLAPLVDLGKGSAVTPAQRIAIAFGLAAAAVNPVAQSSGYGDRISELVASSGSPEFIRAYQDALLRADLLTPETAALGAGAAGGGATGGGSLGGGGTPGGSSGGLGGDRVVATGGGGGFSIGGGGSVSRTVNVEGGVTNVGSDASPG